ncbi:MAG: hypothetical protein JWP91_1370 [Fibrobacteres bacterium]|nr:hypothetical protein [Fibrobacterota bacterium]
MDASLRTLLEGLVDYAGLFPPASLDMASAVRNYRDYSRGPQAPWLGRFVLPVSGLEEFARAAAEVKPPKPGEPEWRLSALIGADLRPDLEAIAAFNSGNPARKRKAVVDTVEMKADRAETIWEAMGKVPAELTPYFEIPIHEDPAPLIAILAEARGRAKVRTGGVTQALIPTTAEVARFILGCARAEVPFKATAGLHHPVRSSRRLTYEPDSGHAVMHGFLNVFLGAAFAAEGMDAGTLGALLEEESPGAFAFAGGEAVWRGHRLTAARLQMARRTFAIAFGSCSFEEPKADLTEAGYL